MSSEPPSPGPSEGGLSDEFAALVGYDLEVTCTLDQYSRYSCEGPVMLRGVAGCCGRTVFTCTLHHRRAQLRQAAGDAVDPVCGRASQGVTWYPA